MRTEDEIINQFADWAEREDNVRAAVLTSSRANPRATVDFLSDYDIELYVLNLKPFRKDDTWVSFLGKIITRWPYKPRSTNGEDWITRLLSFDDGVRIDFQITDAGDIDQSSLDYGFRILIDKDGLLSDVPEPTFSKHNVRKPSKDEYDEIVNEFWWNATYVPKCLWRDELPFAKSMMGQYVQDKYLRTIIEWYIGLTHSWMVNTGVAGRHFKRYLEPEIWKEYESTFAGPGIAESWDAFFNAISLFSRLARLVGYRLGYSYPEETEKEMWEFYVGIRAMERMADNRSES